jgi:hypothetical protein
MGGWGSNWLTSFGVSLVVCSVTRCAMRVLPTMAALPYINPTSFRDVMSTLWRQLIALCYKESIDGIVEVRTRSEG